MARHGIGEQNKTTACGVESFDLMLYVCMNVLLREWRRMTSRRIYLGAAVVLPLFLIFFMATIFGDGQMRHLPIGIVDEDNTATSRSIVRNIAAVPTFDVVAHYANDAEARAAVSRREVYGYLSIPPRFEEAMVRGTDATLCYYYHYALLAVGGEVMSAFETALIPVRMAPIVSESIMLGDTEENIETFLLPMTADDHALYNPSLDYAEYLAVPIFYIMFQILVLLVTLYAVGSDGERASLVTPPPCGHPHPRRTGHCTPLSLHGLPSRQPSEGFVRYKQRGSQWIASADGNILRAVVGKLLPYTVIFTLEALLANVVFFHWAHIPMAGNMWLFSVVVVLFIVATQSVAVILYALFPVLSLVISVVSMVGSLGATLSGLTFPLSAMSPVVQWVAKLFPVRHFTEAMQCMVYFDGGFSDCWPQLAVLCVFPLVMVLLLKIIGLPQKYPRCGLLWEDESSFVATDAFISRRPEEGACRSR